MCPQGIIMKCLIMKCLKYNFDGFEFINVDDQSDHEEKVKGRIHENKGYVFLE